ncbi:MAG: hypothetical protein ACPG21_08380 [Crocinitomicaceae bacterium]
MSLAGFELIDLVEGDKYNNGEVFLMAKTTVDEIKPNFSPYHYEMQRDVFRKKREEEKKISYKLKDKVRKIKKRFLS